MVPSSALCRAQEDLHLRKAADTTLENVRRVATNAAAAWAKEAVAAETREARQLRVRAATPESDVESDNEADENWVPDENPDRGVPDGGPIS